MNENMKPRLVGDSKARKDLQRIDRVSVNNCFGLVVQYHPELGEDIPIICGCGGSGYLCPEHAQGLLQNDA